MKQTDTTIRLSPSDLANHLACRSLTALDLEVATGRRAKPAVRSGFLDMLRARGDEHEKAYVASLRARGLKVVDLSDGKALTVEAVARTREAMAAGADVIVQAPLGEEGWAGYADILTRVNAPGDPGRWSYEVVDTKLARETRGGTVLQLCVYSDLIRELQGQRPDRFHVVSPGEPFVEQTYRLDDFAAYDRLVRAQLEGAVGSAEVTTYPEPVPHCDICRWQAHCEGRRRRDDHLSLVAGIRRTQRAELTREGVTTLTALAGVPLPLPFAPVRGSREAMTRVREQARVQLEGRSTGRLHHELLPVEPERGLLRLPEPSPGDIFLDLEGDPFAGRSGLEYLFGWAVRDEGAGWRYTSRWAPDAGSEKAAFEAFMADAMARLERHPDLHIYHYAPYEPAALKRLMGRYASCADELDRLLRGSVLVDLHAIVRQALIASVERYSLKALEPFYAFTRATPLPEASQALRQVEYLLETGQPLAGTDPLGAVVESYNRDDCLSAAALRDWLEGLRAGLIAEGTALPRPVPQDGSPGERVTERDLRVRGLTARLTADVPPDAAARTPAQQARWLLAQMLAFHRREEKSAWWEFFRLADLEDEARLDEKAALAGLEFVEQVSATKRGVVVNRYRFSPQEVDLDAGAELFTTATQRIGTLAALDRDQRTLDIRHLVAAASDRPTSVVGRRIYGADEQADSLYRIGEWVAEHGLEGPGRCLAARRLLARTPPVFAGAMLGDRPAAADAMTASAAADVLRRARQLAVAVEESTLAVQGPPGSGKTFTGAHMICALVMAGRKVGICATGHKVIRHQMEAALKAADREGVSLRCLQKPKELSEAPGPIRETTSNDEVLAAIRSGEADVIGGTAWLWAREAMQDTVDVLLVDEAGQMSLANVLAISPAARSLILLGDPQQLEQPIQGSHPDGSAVSVLEHVLAGQQTMPAGMGLFLEQTYRMHPAICAFTSELFYEGRLHAVGGLERQRLDGPLLCGAGLWHVPVEHEGNQNASIEEADAVAGLVSSLLGLRGAAPGLKLEPPACAGLAPGPAAGPPADVSVTTWTDHKGVVRPLTLDDILIVAPYNAQVSAIRERLPGARVGTVDRFQGQEAPVVICSMATSSADEAPRGMGFLYSLNRLNVATSRARCAVIVVASPALFAPECQTPAQMRMANAWCRYAERAAPVTMTD